MSKFLVTGGAGFIGSNIAAHLLSEGEDVRVLDNFSTGRRSNVEALQGAEIMEADLCDPQACRQGVEGVDYVLHHAALPSVPRSVEDPAESNRANVDATLNLLLAARDTTARGAGVKRVVFAASSAAYGNQPELPKRETQLPDPLSPYAVAKLTGEHYCKVFHEVYGLETVALRYFNVFGPRQDPASQYAAVIPIFITAMFKGEQPTIFGDGEQSRDFSHVENVIHANILATQSPNAPGHVLNVACGARQTLNQLVETLNELLGTQIEPRYADPRPGDVLHSHADISLAREVLGYEPRVDFREGLRRTVEWYREQLSTGTQ